jgi:hypothetical protein
MHCLDSITSLQGSYRVACCSDPRADRAASTSTDGFCCVFSPTTGAVHARLPHPQAVFGCDFRCADESVVGWLNL